MAKAGLPEAVIFVVQAGSRHQTTGCCQTAHIQEKAVLLVISVRAVQNGTRTAESAQITRCCWQTG